VLITISNEEFFKSPYDVIAIGISEDRQVVFQTHGGGGYFKCDCLGKDLYVKIKIVIENKNMLNYGIIFPLPVVLDLTEEEKK
jgi:hypothetical protein